MSGTAHQRSFDLAHHVWSQSLVSDEVEAAQITMGALRESYGVEISCFSCGGNHLFDVREVEHLVAAMQAHWSDACGIDTTDDGADTPDDVMQHCLLEVLRTSRDPELYSEHIAGAVEARQAGKRLP